MSHLQHRTEIDGLRALAVLPVLLFHAGFPGFAGGFIGVDVFFVISGFLITAILLKENESKRYSVVKFYERRARRLLPALFAVLTVTSIAAYILLPPPELTLYGKSLFASIGMVSNVYFYLTLDYFSVSAERLPLLHMWSLSVEEQFYVIYPIILSVCFFLAAKRFSFYVTLTLLVSSFIAMLLVMANNQGTLGFYFVGTRAWQLLAGSVLAYCIHRLPTSGKLNEIASLSGLALIIFAITQFEATAQYPNALALVPTLGTVLILGFATSNTWVGGKLLSSKPFVFIGLISYSLYLWHQPIFAFLRALNSAHPTHLQFAAGIIASTLLAYITCRFVEAPFRDRNKWSQKGIFIFSALGCFILAAAGLGMYLAKGLPSRYDASMTVDIGEQGERPCVIRDFSDITPGSASCKHNPEKPLTMAIMGDSHGQEMAEALAVTMPNNGIQQITHSGCPPIGDFYHWDGSCREWYPKAVEYLETNKDIEVVIIHYRHALHLYGEMGQHYPNAPKVNPLKDKSGNLLFDVEARYFAALDKLVQRLVMSGKEVVLTSPSPDLPDDIKRLMFPKTIFGSATKYDRIDTVPTSYYHRYYGAFYDYARSASEQPNVTFSHIGLTLCGTHCPAFYEGLPGYFDSNHITLDYAKALAEGLKLHLEDVTGR
jgi:peptidoglycan/LPS O-acetylase OafA/YrhL